MKTSRGWSPPALLAAAALLLPAGRAGALSARNGAAQASFQGLSPGAAYRLDASPPRMTVTDTGAEPIVVSLSLTTPGTGELVDGYEPMPAAWARLGSRTLALSPGQTGVVTGEVRVPAGAREGPGRYQLRWTSVARTASGTALRLTSRVLVGVSDDDLLARAARDAPKERGPFVLAVRQAHVQDAPLGKAVSLARLEAAAKAAAVGERDAVLAVRPVDASLAWDELPRGFAPAPDPRFVRPKDGPVVRVKAGTVAQVPLVLDVPDEPRYRGRRWAFAVAVSDVGGGEPQYFRLLVETAGGTER